MNHSKLGKGDIINLRYTKANRKKEVALWSIGVPTLFFLWQKSATEQQTFFGKMRIISCDKDNVASSGVIKNCGGIIDAEFYSEHYKTIV